MCFTNPVYFSHLSWVASGFGIGLTKDPVTTRMNASINAPGAADVQGAIVLPFVPEKTFTQIPVPPNFCPIYHQNIVMRKNQNNMTAADRAVFNFADAHLQHPTYTEERIEIHRRVAVCLHIRSKLSLSLAGIVLLLMVAPPAFKSTVLNTISNVWHQLFKL